MLIDFREKGRKGESEEEKYQCKRETLISCFLHEPLTDWEVNLQPSSLWDDATTN